MPITGGNAPNILMMKKPLTSIELGPLEVPMGCHILQGIAILADPYRVKLAKLS